MKLKDFRESKRNSFPDSLFFEKMVAYFNALPIPEKIILLNKFDYPKDEIQVILNSGLGNGKGGKFNELAWYFYDHKIIDCEIVNSYDLENYYLWEQKTNNSKCTVCNKIFDYSEYKELRYQQSRCLEHLIKSMDDITPNTMLSECSKDLQKLYWLRITDDTLNELTSMGIIKRVIK